MTTTNNNGTNGSSNHHEEVADEETSLLHSTSIEKSAAPPPSSSHSSASSSFTSWIRLIAFFIASVIAGGILPGQNEYNRLFCEAGVFRYACHDDNKFHSSEGAEDEVFSSATCCSAQWLLIANVMNSLSMVVTFLFLLSGIMFDILGGQKCAVVGCVILSIGFCIIAALLHVLIEDNNGISPSMETLVFAVGILTCDVGSFLVNVGFYGFLWHLPTRQALIVSLSNSCFSCASFLPIMVGDFIEWSGIPLPGALVLYGILIFVGSGGCCWATVPSIEEYHSNALSVLGLPIPKRTVKGLEGIRKQVRGAFEVLTHPDHWKFHKTSICVMVTGWVPAFVYMSMADPLGKEIFQGAEGEGGGGDILKLGVTFLKINSVIGLFVGPAAGIMVDSFQHPSDGLIELCGLMAISLGAVTLLCSVANWTVQIAVLISVCVSQTVMLLFATRYAVVFAYPNRMGTLTGALIAIFGLGSLVLILFVSLYIALTGIYIVPVRVTSALGTVSWAAYAWYAKKETPFPTSPILLPENERDIAKNFGVSTIEDAADVAGMTPEALLKLSSSTKVADLRRLSDAAMSGDACKRLLTVARRRSSEISASYRIQRRKNIEMQEEKYPIPDFASPMVRRGSKDTSFDCITMSFNGHGGFGGKCEPSIDWMCSAMTDDRDDPRRISAIGAFLGPMLAVSDVHGILLEVVVNDEKSPNGKTVAAACGIYPPGSLESDGPAMKAGGDRFHYGLASCNIEPTFMNKELNGEVFVQRLAAFKQDSNWDARRKQYGSMWYVGVLGTHPAFQGNGYGRLLLNVVSHYANKTKNDCYLECSGPNIPFYERCGYNVLWKNEICIHGEGIVGAGMVKKYQAEAA